ncbi:MAG: tRNA (guanosine(46)-N7)-methyltransferase TrmB [Alphaproteobacteria bacterium]|nr:tRNA (guanosine(46)-N7)-methyltransferase TrmB [Alphaproteobacteria bacterium]
MVASHLDQTARRQTVFRGRRHGRTLRARMQTLMRDMLPPITIEPDASDALIDPQSFFENSKREIWMEIGFGAGEHLAWQAERNPDVGFVGCEPYINGVASLLRHAADRDLSNIRILPDDVRPFLDRLPDGCLARLFVLFPDPWPKRRHAGRRIVQYQSLATFCRLLRPGGELRLATDDPGYLRWMLVRATGRSDLCWLVRRPGDWRMRPVDWPQTRYEAKAIEEGRAPAFLRFHKPL